MGHQARQRNFRKDLRIKQWEGRRVGTLAGGSATPFRGLLFEPLWLELDNRRGRAEVGPRREQDREEGRDRDQGQGLARQQQLREGVRKRASEMKEKVINGIKEGGKSYQNQSNFIDWLKASKD
ncbi:hypothetical protein MLD38_011314 [Melastoma candidum]|uniref:Uncharacterized protein n=1 Tax=Melastoma candidum TaxID=119954 RepID=A0ACB9R228_9MYRT|nr:hypothetical protein MLD38_011314 [Melastoma candidum]